MISYGMLLLLVSCQAKMPEQTNTTTIEGWEGNTDFFRLENGVIIAGNLNKARLNSNQIQKLSLKWMDGYLTTSPASNGHT